MTKHSFGVEGLHPSLMSPLPVTEVEALLWELLLHSANVQEEPALCQALALGSGNSAVDVMDTVPHEAYVLAIR